MVAPSILPGVDELELRIRRGDTRAAIAREYGVSRAAVALALLRAGKEPGQLRYNELLPWRVRKAHLRQYPARMLRLEGRVRAGLPIDPEDEGRLATWKRGLAEQNSVIMYLPDHQCEACNDAGGFHWVRREDAVAKFGQAAKGYDTELIFVTEAQARDLKGRND